MPAADIAANRFWKFAHKKPHRAHIRCAAVRHRSGFLTPGDYFFKKSNGVLPGFARL